MATDIHPTAIIHPQAEIGEDCTIGPYCIVGAKVQLGAGSRLQAHVVLDGHLRIGRDADIFPFACLGKVTQDLKYTGIEGKIEIGSGATIREYVTVHMPTGDGLTTIGNDCHLLAYCHIAHDCRLGNGIVMSNSTHLAGHVTVQDHVVFGGMIGVHQFCRIGSMAMIGAHSKVVQDIAPFSLADGNPAVPRSINKIGMSRKGIREETIRAVQKAHRLLFRSGLSQEKALESIRTTLDPVPEVDMLVRFIGETERGLARPPSRKQ